VQKGRGQVSEILFGSVGTMREIVAAMRRSCWCRGGTGHGAHSPADRRAEAGAAPARDCADYRSGAGADQAPA
jgi:hypothetical protein